MEGMDLRKAEGVGQIIECLYGMLSWRNRSDAGQDPLCTHMWVEAHPSLSITLFLTTLLVFPQPCDWFPCLHLPSCGTENNYRALST